MTIQLNVTGINDRNTRQLSMPKSIQTKTFSDSFLYNKNIKVYEKELMNYLIGGKTVNKDDTSFDDIRFLVKKNQVTSYLIKVLDNPLIKLIYAPKPLPKVFKVITAKDVKEDKRPKVFIDVSDIFLLKNGVWHCRNIDIFISYLIDAGNQLIYYADPKRLLMKDGIMKAGSTAFSSLFTYVIDYLFKITAVTSIRDKCTYLSAMYYMINILGKDSTDTVRKSCRDIANISDREEDMIYISIDQDKAYKNIDVFMKALSDYLRLPKLTLDAFLEKWIYVFGTGTQFALELYPSFASMITNVYVGSYLNNQKTIEKIIGKNVVDISTTIINLCSLSL